VTGRCLIPERRELALPQPTWDSLVRRLGLSPREAEVVRGIMEDRSERSIASQLGLSPNTVHTHLVRLYHKLGVGSRTGLVVRVFAEYAAME
jgi:DNA-binding CsgD family transcriptional regulator